MGIGFNPLRTIRGQIFLGFFAMSALISALGGYGIYTTSRANRIVVDIYDRPLMSINFARSASVTFAQMENELLQARLTGGAQAPLPELDQLSDGFFGDLTVAEQRAMSAAAVETAVEIRRLVQEWLGTVRAATRDGWFSDSAAPVLTTLSKDITKAFDRLIELSAEDGFRERRRSLAEISATMIVTIGCTMLALAVAGLVTYVVARHILRPLSVAASAADRIAQGELTVEIPPARQDEIGRLLRSMRSMQASIRTMMDYEAEERRSAQRRLIDAIEGSQEGMMLVGSDGKIVITNTQMRRFLPFPSSYLVPGAPFDEVIAGAIPFGMVPIPDVEANNPRQIAATEAEIRLGNELWLRVSRSSTQDGGFFLFCSDISAIKEREARVYEAKSEAEAANRAKSSFLANMSHELRTPLNAIIGFSEIIALEIFGKNGNPRYQEYGELILTSGRHLLDVISSLLDFAKAEAGQHELRSDPTDLGEIVTYCVNMIQEQCNHKGLTLGRQIPAEPAVILGEPAKLRQILLNLLSNAMKFTPAGGSVQVSLTVEAEGHPMLAVSDSGIGMRPEDISIALTPFGQIDSGVARSYDGTGLGLPLAKAFTELHGASFEIVSQLGEGTTVSLHFIGAGSDDPQEHASASLIGAAAPGPHPLTVDQVVEAEIAESVGT